MVLFFCYTKQYLHWYTKNDSVMHFPTPGILSVIFMVLHLTGPAFSVAPRRHYYGNSKGLAN